MRLVLVLTLFMVTGCDSVAPGTSESMVPELESPVDGVAVPNAVAFSWSAVEGLSSYRFQLWASEGGATTPEIPRRSSKT
ncbi:MAG: hypothetical protein ACI80V_000642 [Rhodothermales bacterium]|jgi:hypothetical protein